MMSPAAFSVVVALATVAIVAACIALAAWLHARRGPQQSRFFDPIGRELGLVVSGGGVRGMLHGVAVTGTIGMVPVAKQSLLLAADGLLPSSDLRGYRYSPAVLVHAPIVPALDLGLLLRSANASEFRRVLLGYHGIFDHQLGDPALDAALVIGADEPQRVNALLSQDARELLVPTAQGSLLLVDDRGVFIERAGPPDAAFLRWALDMAARIARELSECRHRVPPATTTLGLAQGFDDAARLLNFTWSATPLGCWGIHEGVRVHVGTTREARHTFAVAASARFPTPLGLGLSLHSMRAFCPVDLLFMAADVKLGDPQFDETFYLRCADGARLPSVLGPDIRQALLALGEHGGIELRDHGLSLRLTQLPSRHDLLGLIQQLAWLAKQIHARAVPTAAPQSPYR